MAESTVRCMYTTVSSTTSHLVALESSPQPRLPVLLPVLRRQHRQRRELVATGKADVVGLGGPCIPVPTTKAQPTVHHDHQSILYPSCAWYRITVTHIMSSYIVLLVHNDPAHRHTNTHLSVSLLLSRLLACLGRSNTLPPSGSGCTAAMSRCPGTPLSSGWPKRPQMRRAQAYGPQVPRVMPSTSMPSSVVRLACWPLSDCGVSECVAIAQSAQSPRFTTKNNTGHLIAAHRPP